MAITKLTKNPCNTDEALNNLCDYIIDPAKTNNYVGGQYLRPSSAYNDINTAQALWKKQTGRRAYHFIVGFEDAEVLLYSDALEIAKRIAQLFPEYQVLYGVHITQEHLHIHFAINLVSLRTGLKLQMDYSFLSWLQTQVNLIIFDYFDSCIE